MAKDTQEVSDGNGPVGEPEPALRGGGLPLPGLRHWRKRRGISQAELARRADLSSDYLFKIESRRRACRPEAADLLADLLGVGLEALRSKPGAAFDMETPPKPSRPKVSYRHVHQAYLRIMLEGAVDSAYAAMDEWEVEERLEGGHVGRSPRDRPGEGAGDRAPPGRARGQGGAGRPRPARRRAHVLGHSA